MSDLHAAVSDLHALASSPRADEHPVYLGQRMLVVPRAQVAGFLADHRSPGLAVSDCGYFPRADRHFRARVDPIPELVLVACMDGRGWIDTGSGSHEVGPGQMLVIPPHRLHAYGAVDDDPWTVWWVHLTGKALAGFSAAHDLDDPARVVREPTSFFEIASLMAQIVAVLEVDMTVSSLTRAAGTGWHLLSLLATDPARSGRPSSEMLEAVAAAIRDDLITKASASRFAAGAHMSVSHFSTLFRERFGVSVQTYQLNIRMARARELFDVQRLSVAEVARTVGYDDALYFSRQFARVHGIPPSAYRAGARGAAPAS